MPAVIAEKASNDALNDSIQTDDDIHELKKKIRAVKTMPWDLWEIDSSMKALVSYSRKLKTRKKYEPQKG